MAKEADTVYYRRRAKQQLEIANAASDPAAKAIHLDLASRYATLAEQAETRGSSMLRDPGEGAEAS